VTFVDRLQSLWSGYGELWRAELNESGKTTSVVIKHVQPPHHDASRSHQRKLRSYDVERAFYERYAGRCLDSPGCPVPRPRLLQKEGGGWLFVLEDLDASGFSERISYATPPQISATLRWLAAFHARFLGTAPDGLWKVGSYWHLATRPDELRAMRHPALREAATRIDARLNGARFKTLVHGDAKLENVCFARANDAGKGVCLVDFQYVGGGVGVKDVAYLLNGCLSARDCESAVPKYLDEYFQELRAALTASNSESDAEQVEREWRALFPFAWVDFYRFLLGWAPGQLDGDRYSERLTKDVLSTVTSG
jgi:hypothetical protein